MMFSMNILPQINHRQRHYGLNLKFSQTLCFKFNKIKAHLQLMANEIFFFQKNYVEIKLNSPFITKMIKFIEKHSCSAIKISSLKSKIPFSSKERH